ncbi:MAG: CDP-diacylglycerol--serine O-phosphatidyltransferase [Desulfovibrio sp.]
MSSEKKLPRHKSVYILPNMLTVASLFLGFLGMTWAIDGKFELCAMAILGSCLFDGLDGKVARLTGTSSEFGVQLDSLADLVAFGVTPAIMTYYWQLHQYGRLGLMASFLLIACGAMRLARFNVQAAVTSKKFFIGLPIPAAACTLASLVLFQEYVPAAVAAVLPMFALVLVYLVSFFMVSTIRFFSFKEFAFVKAHPFSSLVTAILIFSLIASRPALLGFIIFIGYLISGPAYTLIILSKRSSKLLRESNG